jgi:hypothetical protein
VNIDPLKRQSSESVGTSSVSRRSSLSTAAQTSSGTTDDAELDNITQQNLLDLVKDMPEVRTEVTDIGMTLANDPNYPSEEAVDKLATLMMDMEPGWMDSIDAEEETTDENA